MKQLNGFLTKAAACGVALVAASWMFSAQAAQGKAVVRAIRSGYADYSEDGKTWKRLVIGHVLRSGNTVKTDKNAVVDLYLGSNGPVVRVTADTMLELTTLTFEQTAEETVIDTELGMSNGRILGSVKRLAAASKYEVKTPVGVAAMRGTQFDITYRAGVPMRLSVVEGSVIVRFGTQTFTVGVGQTFDASANNGQGGVSNTPPETQAGSEGQLGEAIYTITITTPGVPEVTIPVSPRQNPTTEI
jgi:hypothetical protein